MKRKGTKDLTLTQRREIENHLKSGCSKKRIAELLGVCLATVYNELKRGQCTQKVYSYTDYWGERHYKQVTAYSADIAEYKYRLNQSAHGAPLKIGNDYELVREIENRVINEKISPCAALGRIKREKACRTTISKTTLYRYIRAGYIFTRITMSDVQLKQRHYQKATIKRPPNVRYSWGISGILNQNSVNSEFVNRRPKNLRSFFTFFIFTTAQTFLQDRICLATSKSRKFQSFFIAKKFYCFSDSWDSDILANIVFVIRYQNKFA